MNLVYDAAKDAANIAKHGVSLCEATNIEWDTALSIEDGRKDYGEVRVIAYAIMGSRLYCVVYTDRADSRRVISLRKANKREVAYYVANS